MSTVLKLSWYFHFPMSSEKMSIDPLRERPNSDYHLPFPWWQHPSSVWSFPSVSRSYISEHWLRSHNSDQLIWLFISTTEFSLLIMPTWFLYIIEIDQFFCWLSVYLVPRISCSSNYLCGAQHVRPLWLPFWSSHSLTFYCNILFK